MGALERARAAYGTGAYDDATIEFLFPEVKESEDELTRKCIMETIRQCTDILDPKNQKRMLDWLENQKEPRHAIRVTKGFGDPDGPQFELADLQKVQKPTEKQDYAGLTDLEKAIHRGFLSAGVENVPVTIIKETAKECLAQMKPAEWSEEDEKMRNNLIELLIRLSAKTRTDSTSINYSYPREIDWLKSLRPDSYKNCNSRWKPSEEQMRFLLAVINEPNNAGSESCHIILKSLYHDLKNLK